MFIYVCVFMNIHVYTYIVFMNSVTTINLEDSHMHLFRVGKYTYYVISEPFCNYNLTSNYYL